MKSKMTREWSLYRYKGSEFPISDKLLLIEEGFGHHLEHCCDGYIDDGEGINVKRIGGINKNYSCTTCKCHLNDEERFIVKLLGFNIKIDLGYWVDPEC
jgi:hypothetical protein